MAVIKATDMNINETRYTVLYKPPNTSAQLLLVTNKCPHLQYTYCFLQNLDSEQLDH